jgi:methionine synthase I (cobalamin-dependent)/5,10-methylenetetrahydrofolate reductase
MRGVCRGRTVILEGHLSRFLEVLEDRKVLVFDGAMGTLLYDRGVPAGSCYDELNLTRPQIVRGVSADYASAGADILTTNTFGANPVILERYYGLGQMSADINTAGVEIARSASAGRLVAGSVGPLSRPAEVLEEIPPGLVSDAFRLQIGALTAAGVDLVVFETFSDPAELASAIDALHEVSPGTPCVALLTFLEGGQTLGGLHPLHAGHLLGDLEADVVGVNCGTGPMDMLKVITRIAQATGRKLCAMPNAGLASFERGRFVYPNHPEHLGLYAARLVAAGCSLVGGCCGTTPLHTSAIKSAIGAAVPGRRRQVRVAAASGRDADEKTPVVETTLAQMLSRRTVLSVEVDPPRGPDGAKLLGRLRRLKGIGVDAVNVSDGPMARLRMSPAAFSMLVRRDLNLEVIVHSTCRDKNLLALQSDILGLSAMGLRNILALSGDPPSIGDYPFATAVYDVRSEGLVRVVDYLNRGKDILGNKLNAPAGIFCGTGITSCPADADAELKAIERKAAAGLRFLQTQPVFDAPGFLRFFEKVRGLGLPVVAGVMPVLEMADLEYLRNEVPGIAIPDALVDRFRSCSSEASRRELGLGMARGVIEELKCAGLNGICIMPALCGYDVIDDLLHQ